MVRWHIQYACPFFMHYNNIFEKYLYYFFSATLIWSISILRICCTYIAVLFDTDNFTTNWTYIWHFFNQSHSDTYPFVNFSSIAGALRCQFEVPVNNFIMVTKMFGMMCNIFQAKLSLKFSLQRISGYIYTVLLFH